MIEQLIKALRIEADDNFRHISRKDDERGRFIAVELLQHRRARLRISDNVVLLESNLSGFEVDPHQFAGKATGLGEQHNARHHCRPIIRNRIRCGL